jgi:superfamily II DNA or RNA helicase
MNQIPEGSGLMPLRESQIEALERLHYHSNSRGILGMPTGVGKTHTIITYIKEVVNRDKQTKMLFIAHNNNLLLQSRIAFEKELSPSIKCGSYNAQEKNIQQFTFATIQTLSRNLTKFKPEDFDYIIVDEAHHYRAKTFQKALEYFKPKVLRGLTATPFRTDKKSIKEVFGEIISEQDVHTCILRGELCKFDYLCARKELDFSGISHNGYRYSEKDINKKLVQPENNKLILENYLSTKAEYGRKRTICFCSTKKQCLSLEKEFKTAGISCASVLEDTPNRQNIIDDIKHGLYEVAFSVNILGEGADLPETDMIMMLRPTESNLIFMQQLGRGLRKFGDKRLIVLDFTGNAKGCNINLEALKKYYGFDLKDAFKAGRFRKVNERGKEYYSLEVPDIGTIKLSWEKIDLLENYRPDRNLEDAITEFNKIYGDKKPGRRQLYKENRWIEKHFQRNKLLDKYCQDSKCRNLEQAIAEYHKLYKDKKPGRVQLERENEWIYKHFLLNNLLDKYCLPPHSGRKPNHFI